MAEPAGTPPPLFKIGEQAGASFGICIYGKGGMGKTSMLATMPGRGLIIDVPQIEGGTFVLPAEVSDRIDVTPVATWDEIQKVYWFLAKGKHTYAWCAIDSITAFQELATRKVVGERPEAVLMDQHTITQQEWGKIGSLLGELIYQFRKLPTHTIWIAQERKFGKDDGPTELGPAVTPGALGKLIPSMLLVGHLSVSSNVQGQPERRLRIGPHNKYYTKVRARAGLDVPSVVANPRLDVILKFLLGTGPRPEEAQDSAMAALISLTQ